MTKFLKRALKAFFNDPTNSARARADRQLSEQAAFSHSGNDDTNLVQHSHEQVGKFGTSIAETSKARISARGTGGKNNVFTTFTKSLPDQSAMSEVQLGDRKSEYERLPGICEVLGFIKKKEPVIMVHGGAGVGKTHFIRYLKLCYPGGERQATVAPTAIAAMTSQAQTIHSFFQFPPKILDPEKLEPFKGKSKRLWYKMQRLVIDEISMVRPDIIDAIHRRLQLMRESDLPFGGVQVILVGDPLQLPPVIGHGEMNILHGMGYKSPFFYSAHVWNKVRDFPRVELTEVYRQRDPEFITALNNLRTGQHHSKVLALFNDRCVRPHREDRIPLLLTPTRREADYYNGEGLNALMGPEFDFIARTTGKIDIRSSDFMAPERLKLKRGAIVMAVANDAEKRWINGSRGIVLEWDEKKILVHFDDTDKKEEVERYTWNKIKQVWDPIEQKIVDEVIGNYEQFPLTYGWAITIHKSQGMSLTDVRVDMGSGAFTSGQTYVALSRARNLEGLSLATPLNSADIKVNPELLRFIDVLKS